MEQVFFNVPLAKLEPIFKRWIKEAQSELQVNLTEQTKSDQWFGIDDLLKYDPAKRTKPTWYGLVSRGEVPYHKNGKHLVFLKSEIDAWLKTGKRKSNSEIELEAENYLSEKKAE